MTYLIIGLALVGVIALSETAYAARLATFFNDYDTKIKVVAMKYNIPWYWIKGIALNESLLGQDSLVKAGKASSDGLSYGIMQFTIATADTYAKRLVMAHELNDVDFSFDLAGKFLSNLNEVFKGNEYKVITAYNQGKAATLRGDKHAEAYYYRYLYWKRKILADPKTKGF